MPDELDKRYQTLVALWFSLLMSIGMYLLVAVFVAPQLNPGPASAAGPMLSVVLTAVGIMLVIVSFPVKGKLLERSITQQDASLVQKALVIACAMCEACALLGLVERFVVGKQYYYLLFIVGAFGIALHFPRRQQLEAATYKTTGQLVQ
jgi:FtsH-binding integral membrane protein